MKLKTGQCLIEECSVNKIYSRGLCPSHYRMISFLVRHKKRTWEEFEEVGMSRKIIGSQALLLQKMMIKKNLIAKDKTINTQNYRKVKK